MGFLDRAKSSLSERFSVDEVVRKGKFDSREEESEEPQDNPRVSRVKPPKPKVPRAPKPQKVREAEPEEFKDDPFDFTDETTEDSYSFEIPEEPEAAVEEVSLAALSKDEGQSVSDILKSMRISETFTIDEGILFVDESLATRQFATQAPYGYDMGEVDFFLTQTQRSVAEYVRLLRLRNDDVVKLATRLSDLMVEINNMRFNAEVANGINIMASAGDDDAMAVELQEARSRAQRLQEQLSALSQSGQLSEQSEDELRSLRNELAAERVSRQRFETEAQDLRAHLVLIEEEYDIQVFSERGDLELPTASGFEGYEQQKDGGFQRSETAGRAEKELYDEEENYQKVGRDHWLPGVDSDEEEELPDGSFSLEEESLEEISLGSFEGSEGGFEQSTEGFQDSGFTADPYQNLDEFIEDNITVFPEDNSFNGKSDGTIDDDDPDEDGFQYDFETRS